MNQLTTASTPVAGAVSPRLSAALVIFAAIVSLNLMSPMLDGRQDPDFWWHLSYGKKMIELGGLPSTDFLTWTFQGSPYLLTQWLGQLLITVVYLAAGPVGTSLLTLGVIAAIVATSWRTAVVHLRHPVFALGAALFATQALWSLLARPQMFGFLCMAGVVYLVERAQRTEWDLRGGVSLAILFAAWVNLHGSFAVGVAYLVLVIAALGLEALSCSKPSAAIRTLLWPTVTLFLAALGTLVNPNGWRAWAYVVEIAGYQTTTSGVISEWVPTSLGRPSGATYIAVLLLTMVVFMARRQRLRISEGVQLLGVAFFGLLAGRQSYFAAIALVPLLAKAASDTAFYNAFAERVPVTVRVVYAAIAVSICVALGLAQARIQEPAAQRAYQRFFPVGAAEFLAANAIDGKLYNEATVGGWIGFNTGHKVFIDGRLDLFKDAAFFDWFYTRQGAPQWLSRLQVWDPEVFVLQNQSALRQLLIERPEYALVYEDVAHSVVLKRSQRFEPLVRLHERAPAPFVMFGKDGKLQATLMGW